MANDDEIYVKVGVTWGSRLLSGRPQLYPLSEDWLRGHMCYELMEHVAIYKDRPPTSV